MNQSVQVRLQKNVSLRKPYSYGPYNKVKGKKQAIRLTEGCVWNCPQCKEPLELKIFGIPEIVKKVPFTLRVLRFFRRGLLTRGAFCLACLSVI